ncbi:MAG: hypothetical protein H0X41_11410 [Chitinophagaceae bacterium]|nr:hypothetical protein [Chitinophagaceae bacterium]
MKKTAAILLLALLAFNWIGYRFVSGLLEQKADVALESRIDKADYDEASLIQITVPLNAPYLSGNSTDFERCDGKIELEGVHYRYVKRKIAGGNLVLLCIPNESKKRFQNARMDFFKLVNDLGHSTQGKEKNSGSSFKSFTTEYSQENNSWNISALLPMLQQNHVADLSFCSNGFGDIPKQPPRA